jgi:predicted enzyme related to lactoylglutathione lyase
VGNPIIHVEVVGKNAKGLQQFFGDLFDWDVDTDYPNDYGIAEKAGGGGADFGAGPSPDGGAGQVTFYVRVPDIDATLAKAASMGASVVMPKFAAGNATLALFADPEGHVIGLTEGSM